MKAARALFQFLADAAVRGEQTALVTITGISGGSSRALGTQMAVAESGSAFGSLSGGCVESAVVSEALRIMATGQGELIRFGSGSRFLDLRLPCGGSMDLLFTPRLPPNLVFDVLHRLDARQTATLRLGRDGAASLELDAGADTGWDEESYLVRHEPEMRIVIVGHGAEPVALARMASCFGAEIEVLSPDQRVLEAVRPLAVRTVHLAGSSRSHAITADCHTAIVMLFHDHHWEHDFLADALRQDAFFIGAMGSRTAHARRLEALRGRGFSMTERSRITGPIGLIPAARDPDTLALSILSQVTDVYRRSTRPVFHSETQLMPGAPALNDEGMRAHA